MAPLPPHIEHILERFEPLGPVVAKRMFGGFGFFADDCMFALFSGEQLYLKADDRNRPRFEAEGLEPFRSRRRKGGRMPYYPPPESALDDDDELLDWARSAVDAAFAARKI
ncbi:MAG: TfoX/Sxy family protein [Rhodospirillaceae bacterium]|jgi:DNA transformation protein and related proteins|nr:TfoX/Sxy family protein [Rhodospirillaceae bacterium]MBT6138363.1 TfoX/Sxy family protein [Rhodospirillaceae bacterium]